MMTFPIRKLPYPTHALEPVLSEETLRYHHGKHYAGYVRTLNSRVQGTPLERQSLVDLVVSGPPRVWKIAAQAWNHDFYFRCMKPRDGEGPGEVVADALRRSFGGVASFQERFAAEAQEHFGSGWVWLVKTSGAVLDIECTHDAGNPLRVDRIPLLACDLWEHAYYLDYRHDRRKYLDAWWQVVNWPLVEEHLRSAGVVQSGRDRRRPTVSSR